MLAAKQVLVSSSPVWPQRSFSDKHALWDYALSEEEKQRLDTLMGLALLDAEVCERLLHKRDEDLMIAYGLSAETCAWLRELKATSLEELAAAIISAQ